MSAVRRRRWIVGVGAALALAVLALAGGHTGQHVVRSLLVPGAGLYGERPVLGVGLTVLAVLATVAWLRWGVDWSVAAVVVLAVVLTVVLADTHPPTSPPAVQRSAHEFPLVVLVLAAIGWLRGAVRRVPVLSRVRLRRRPVRHGPDDIGTLPPVDRCRAAAIAALAKPWPEETAERIVAAIEDEDVSDRARRVGLAARLRMGGDPLRIDHAHARAALSLWGRLDDDAQERFRTDAERAWTGAPASEPGWVRLLDATLVARALADECPSVARRWSRMLEGPMALGRKHRPAWTWTPLGIAAGRPDDWEHATATALARSEGWIGDDDWSVIRPRALGAAARGSGHWADERLIAAGRAWAALVGDESASRLLDRPTIRHDPLAVALDAYARRVGRDPSTP